MEQFMKLWHQLTDLELKCPQCRHTIPFSLMQWNTYVRCNHCQKKIRIGLKRWFIATMFMLGLLLYTLLYLLLQQLTTDFMLIMIILVLFLFAYSAIYTKVMIHFYGLERVYEIKVQK